MKRFFALILTVCMMMTGSALAIGRALPQEQEIEVTYQVLDCFELMGMTEEEIQALLDEQGRKLFGVQLKYKGYPKDGELVDGFNGFAGNGAGIGVYGLSVNMEFNGELSEEMIADGWQLIGRQFEGGFWYNRLECPSKIKEGHTAMDMYIQTDGFKIMYMEFELYELKEYLAEKAVAAAEEAVVAGE